MSRSFHNPVDGRTYIAPGGWRNYRPDQARPQESAGVRLESVTLLTAQADFDSRTSEDDLATFIREVVRLAENPLGSAGTQIRVMVQFKCRPDGHDVELAHQGDAPQERLQQYYDALIAAKRLPVSHGELSFLVEISADPSRNLPTL
jgi:hypothetical protein